MFLTGPSAPFGMTESLGADGEICSVIRHTGTVQNCVQNASQSRATPTEHCPTPDLVIPNRAEGPVRNLLSLAWRDNCCHRRRDSYSESGGRRALTILAYHTDVSRPVLSVALAIARGR